MMATLTAERVHEIVIDALYRDDELYGNPDGQPEGVVAEGLVRAYTFHPERVAAHKAEIGELLAELPDEFQLKKGGGWTFLNACMDKHGRQWGEHVDIEALICLGIATKQANWQMRDMAAALPGGVPYVVVGDDIILGIDQALAAQAAEHDRRVSELLAANNREVNRRRAVEDALHRLLVAVEQVEYIGLDEDLYQAAVSIARAVLAHA